MKTFSRLVYRGQVPGADTNTYVLFDTTVVFPGANMSQQGGLKRFRMDLAHSQAGTLVLSKSEDRGRTWYVVDTTAVVAPTYTTTYDQNIEPYSDWKVEWVNGGLAQTSFTADMGLIPQRPEAGSGPTPPVGDFLTLDDLTSILLDGADLLLPS